MVASKSSGTSDEPQMTKRSDEQSKPASNVSSRTQ